MNPVRSNYANGGSPVRRSLADEFFGGFGRLFDDMGTLSSAPAGMDFYETEDSLVLELAVPGVKSGDIDVNIEGRQLTIRAELPEVAEEGRRYWVRSLPRGAFSRNVRLPAGIDGEGIEARVEAGLLVLRIPKAAEARSRRIEISEG
ncbi:MAG TPA: Hsp20/alpha crystallin family protein [Deinococcales bacterium]|nr:Hsp20/alpha crystallin family protein [Deinococcales bacterium]